jgi:hypothetical protein
LKKKSFVFLLSCFFIISSLHADFNYQFDLISLDPLHKEYFADRARPGLSVNALTFFEGFPDRVLQDKAFDTTGNGNYDLNKVLVWNFTGDLKPKNQMVEFSLGETMSIGRSTFTFDNWLSPISFDISMQGVIQSFYEGGLNDSIGYDGIYFVGGTLRIADFISTRIGIHHYCSHYGDGTISLIQDCKVEAGSNSSDFDDFWMTYKYVRMNAYVLGLSIEPSPMLRIYGELNFPPKKGLSLRPNMFAPNWIIKSENIINETYPDWYNARIINLGIELNFPLFENLGNTTLGYDLHMYEEGKVIYDHFNGGAISFDENAPWELEHNIRIAQNLNNRLSFECAYHYGRSPLSSFFFQQSSYLSLGLRFDPQDTITLFNNNNK